jgi:hypothetical protein
MDLETFEINCKNKTKQNHKMALFKTNRAGIPPASLETSFIKKDRYTKG